MPRILEKEIGSTGYGMMGLTFFQANNPTEEEALVAMKAALTAGCNLWDAGEFYGTPENNSLTLLEKYFTKYPEDAPKVLLVVKGGVDTKTLAPDGSPEAVRKSVNNCLTLLNGKKSLDIFEMARVDKKVPIETSLKFLDDEFVKTGKIGGISISEVSAETIRKAVKVTKVLFCEVEVSLWAMDIFSNGIAQACAENNIPIAAYSPIGRGMLSGQIKSPDDLAENDGRRRFPRFYPENFHINLKLVQALQEIAKKKGCTPAQLAIAWVKHLSKKDGNPELIPIPGASSEAHVKENTTDVPLAKEEVAEIEGVLGQFSVSGDRYGGHGAALMNG